MKMQTAACLVATLVVGMSGCSTPHATTRGQSIQQVKHDHNVNTVPNRSGNVNSVQNYFHDQHDFGNSASYHSTSGFPGYNGFAEYGGPGGASCPPGGCPQGACPPGGGCGHGCGQGGGLFGNYHSYSYQRPQNLCYPDQNAVGGAVVYPYYTHKGPSDFFRDDCCKK